MCNDIQSPGLYIHIPFCVRKCPYCDFYSSEDTQQIDSFLDALDHEARLYQEQFKRFGSLYIGGGTPSLLSARACTRLLEIIKSHFTFTESVEVTLEANPDDISPQKASLYRDLGINRISLGIQSFDDEVLKFLQRRHTADQAGRAVSIIREAGFDNLALDLMYAVPGQSESSWRDSLQQALRCTPEHLSCYQLTIKKQTPFHTLKTSGTLKPLPDDAQEELFLQTSDFLRKNGYIHYEISNFAKNKACYARHNANYWLHVPYLGLGPSAHSFDGTARWWNNASVSKYIDLISHGTAPVQKRENLSADQRRLEKLLLGMRTRRGIELDTLSAYPQGKTVLPGLVEKGLLEIFENRIQPTTRGFLVADSLPLLFL